MELENFHSIIEILRQEGAPEIAQEIQDQINTAMMGTELYGNVGLILKKVATSNVSELTKARAHKMRKDIAVFIKLKPDDL